MSGTYRWYWLKRQFVCGRLCGLCVWNIQIILIKKTACLWLTLLSLCLEWTVLSERQLTAGQPVQQCVWKWQTALIRKTVPLWSMCILLCLQRAESIVRETVHFWPKCPPLCLEHTESIVRKTVHFWSNCPPLCLKQTDSTGYKHRLHVANLPISVRLISQGCFQTFLPAGCHCTNCVILLYHTHMDIACNFITNIFQYDTNLNPTCWHSSTIVHIYLVEAWFVSWPHIAYPHWSSLGIIPSLCHGHFLAHCFRVINHEWIIILLADTTIFSYRQHLDYLFQLHSSFLPWQKSRLGV